MITTEKSKEINGSVQLGGVWVGGEERTLLEFRQVGKMSPFLYIRD